MAKTNGTLRERQHAATLASLLDSAERTMIRRGYDRATMQEIAAEAGCATGTCYLYFKTKEALLQAIVDRHAMAMLGVLRSAMAEAEAPLEKIRAATAAFLHYGQRQRSFFRLFFTAVPVRHRLIRQRFHGPGKQEFDAHDQVELENLRKAQKQGAIRKDLPVETLQAFMEDVAFSLIEQFVFSQRKQSVEEQMRILWGLLTGGIAAGRS